MSFSKQKIMYSIFSQIFLTFICLFVLTACGKSESVSFDSAEGLTKKQIENEINEQTEEYGGIAEQQTEEIYDATAEKGMQGYDALIQTAEDIAQGKAKGINAVKLSKNILFYFLVFKHYLYNNLLSVLAVWWLIVGLLVIFFRLRNKALARSILVVLGFGVTLLIAVVVFSPVLL